MSSSTPVAEENMATSKGWATRSLLTVEILLAWTICNPHMDFRPCEPHTDTISDTDIPSAVMLGNKYVGTDGMNVGNPE
jgi:hypothetical protein